LNNISRQSHSSQGMKSLRAQAEKSLTEEGFRPPQATVLEDPVVRRLRL
jgi:hypothetical protein